MKPHYASDTKVPVINSQAEIQTILMKYGAEEFASGFDKTSVKIGFVIKGTRVRISFLLPAKDERRFTHYERINHGRKQELSRRLRV